MIEELIIPEKLVGTELLCYLYPKKFDDQKNKSAVDLLHKICFANLTDFDNSTHIKNLMLTEEERDTVLKNKWNSSANLEVKARCNDVLSRFESDKRNIKILASDTYLAAYKEFDETDFLIRSVTVRDFKQINTKKFLQDIITVVLEREIPSFWLKKLIESLLRSYSFEELEAIATYIDSKRIEANKEKHFRDERNYIEALKMLRYFEDIVYHKLLALSFESEADTTMENKEANTYYPNLVDDYQNAYNEIVQIKGDEPSIFERIKEKLLLEKKVFMKMFPNCDFKNKMATPQSFVKNADTIISNTTINTFIDTLDVMTTIPFMGKEEVEKYESISKKTSPMSCSSNYELLDVQGNIIGRADPITALRTKAHVHLRQLRLYFILSYFDLHYRSKIETNEELVYHVLEKYKPVFINEDNLIVWTKGINAGFNQDFIISSSVLMPQLEHALHNIAEIKNGNITTLASKKQLSPTLGSILPMLKDWFKDEVYFEISSFLQGEIDVNFRNNLLHGLFKPFEIEKYGRYLWWICVKLYFDEKSFMK